MKAFLCEYSMLCSGEVNTSGTNEMRRREREITDSASIEAFVAQQKILRIGFSSPDGVYIVPVNYGYCCDQGYYTFFFHGARGGRKFELALNTPCVGFEIDGEYELLPGETACLYSAAYRSIIGNGQLFLIEDEAEKRLALDTIMHQATGQDDWIFPSNAIRSVAVYKLVVGALTCKAHVSS
jgi:nitroimidazol reductase NimA-like FMN-containing flavoprotein (pyridoxamine 5'-phosphate oxidase superfamily)